MNAFWTAAAIDGAVLSAALGLVILVSLAYNPRMWVNDAPPRVRELAPPLTPVERRDRNITAIVFILTIVVVTAWSAVRLAARHPEGVTFVTALTHFAVVFFVFNLFDLVIIDWLVLLVMRPRFLTGLAVPGLSYEETVGGYGYHFIGFLKGIAFVATFSTVAAAIASLAA